MHRMKKQIIIDSILAVSLLLVLISGYILDFHLVDRAGRGIVKTIHTYGSYVMTAAAAIHLWQYFHVFVNKASIAWKK